MLPGNSTIISSKFKIQSAHVRNRLNAFKHERYTCTNSVDPDETPQNAASHQGMQCLPKINTLLVMVDYKPYMTRPSFKLRYSKGVYDNITCITNSVKMGFSESILLLRTLFVLHQNGSRILAQKSYIQRYKCSCFENI